MPTRFFILMLLFCVLLSAFPAGNWSGNVVPFTSKSFAADTQDNLDATNRAKINELSLARQEVEKRVYSAMLYYHSLKQDIRVRRTKLLTRLQPTGVSETDAQKMFASAKREKTNVPPHLRAAFSDWNELFGKEVSLLGVSGEINSIKNDKLFESLDETILALRHSLRMSQSFDPTIREKTKSLLQQVDEKILQLNINRGLLEQTILNQ